MDNLERPDRQPEGISPDALPDLTRFTARGSHTQAQPDTGKKRFRVIVRKEREPLWGPVEGHQGEQGTPHTEGPKSHPLELLGNEMREGLSQLSTRVKEQGTQLEMALEKIDTVEKRGGLRAHLHNLWQGVASAGAWAAIVTGVAVYEKSHEVPSPAPARAEQLISSRDLPLWRETRNGTTFDGAVRVDVLKGSDGSRTIEVNSPDPLEVTLEGGVEGVKTVTSQDQAGRYVTDVVIPSRQRASIAVQVDTSQGGKDLLGDISGGNMPSDTPVVIYSTGHVQKQHLPGCHQSVGLTARTDEHPTTRSSPIARGGE